MNDMEIFKGVAETFFNLAKGVVPLVLVFFLFQLLYLKLPRFYIIKILKGTGIALVGLVLFLQAVNIGFLPAGKAIGEMMGGIRQTWLLIPFGFAAGFLTAFSEPAVRLLSSQVEESSGGSIRKPVVLNTISIGVAVFASLGMARIVYGISLLHIIIPGYLLALLLARFSEKSFISIALDSGAVATGPMVVIFLMAITLGASSVMDNRDTIVYGLGIVALLVLAPILSIMLLGLAYSAKLKQSKGVESDD